MNIDLKYISQFKSVIEDIVDKEIKNAGITKYISAIVQKINDDGTVDVYLPPDKNNLITGIFNRCGELLFVGDSVEIATKNGSLTNAWVFVKHGTNISGYSNEVEELGASVVLKVSNGRLVTTTLTRSASLGNSITILADDINLDGYNINLNGSRGITITSPYFNVTKTGVITATSGSIGGWTMGATRLSSGSGNNYVGLDSGTQNVNYAIWAGNETPANAPFSVTRAGAVTASNVNITGGTLSIGSNFSVTNTGVLNASGATISGNITATSGSFGTGETTINIGTNNSGAYSAIYSVKSTIHNDNDGFYLGANGLALGKRATYTVASVGTKSAFEVSTDGTLYAQKAYIEGAISTTSGKIGGWTIGEYRLSATGTQTDYGAFGMVLDVKPSVKSAIWIGTDLDADNAVFRVRKDGKLFASNAEVKGKIEATSGTFDNVTINSNCTINGTFDASKITSGTFETARIPTLSADKIYAGTLSASNINLNSGTVKLRTNGHIEFTNGVGFFVMGSEYGSVGATTHPYVSALNVSAVQNAICFRNSSSITSPGTSNYCTIGVSTYTESGTTKHSLLIQPGDRFYIDSHYGMTTGTINVSSIKTMTFYKGMLVGISYN